MMTEPASNQRITLADLDQYLYHMHECSRLRNADPESPTYGKCTCGLEQVLTRLRAADETAQPPDDGKREPALALVREFVAHFAGAKASQLGTGYVQQWYQRARALTERI